MSSFLTVEQLRKSFPSGNERLHILVNLSLQVEKGRMIAITGASGSGKSTFLHLLGGMETADSGRIVLDGKEVTGLLPTELARFRGEKIGFIFQFHHLLPEFSALENVMFPLLLRRVPFVQAAERARALLDEVSLGDRSQHRPGELSGGEQQRVAVARALVGKPSLLLGDEPTGNLDEHTSQSVYELLQEVHERHQLTSIIVTHNSRLASLCHVEKHLKAGKLVDVPAPRTQ